MQSMMLTGELDEDLTLEEFPRELKRKHVLMLNSIGAGAFGEASHSLIITSPPFFIKMDRFRLQCSPQSGFGMCFCCFYRIPAPSGAEGAEGPNPNAPSGAEGPNPNAPSGAEGPNLRVLRVPTFGC